MDTLKKLLDLLTPHERKRATMLLGMILVMALLEVIGVASIMPFIAVLANPQLVETNTTLVAVSKTLRFTNTQDFLFFLGVAMFLVLVISLAFKALTIYVQLRFTYMREYSVGKRLIEGYLHQPYSWFLNRHSADLGKTILSEVSLVIQQAMIPVMNIIAQSAITISLLLLLLFVDPQLALTVGAVFTIAYGLIFKLMSGYLSHIGHERVIANQQRFSAVSEAFNAAKEIKVSGLEKAYIKRFSLSAAIYARHQATAQIVGQLPRFMLEAIAFGGMFLLVLYLMTRTGNFASALPSIALYAFAGYRLMPALQQIYSNFSQLRFATPALEILHADLMGLQAPEIENATNEKMQLREVIELNNIQFSYPNARQPAIKDLNLRIPAQSRIGLIGSTGSGKTTTVDLILVLLDPQEGTLTVDGQIINASNRRQWQKTIGYVPQQIYLADDTVAANIAFGLDEDNIDQAAVERAAKIANLHHFVVNELPQGYSTMVGERGVRLSGGQRQRIGIARALYHEPKVLILDEATSALDNLTEQAVMEAVNNLGNSMTIIMIAHRLSTVRNCDQIYLLEKGKVKTQGTYEHLAKVDDLFRAMAQE